MLFHLKQILIFKRKYRYFYLIIIISSLSLTGCTSLAILGAGAGGVITGGYIMGRDKTVKQSTDDVMIESQIRHKLSKQFPRVFTNIKIVTDNGCVLLAGNVQEDKYIEEAEKIAWTVDGVKHIDNNLTCNSDITVSQSLQDGYITSACRTRLVATKNIKSRNIKIKTVLGTVYLSGIAHSNDELEDIVSVVKSIRGVKKVISYIKIKEEVVKTVK